MLMKLMTALCFVTPPAAVAAFIGNEGHVPLVDLHSKQVCSLARIGEPFLVLRSLI